MQRMTDEEVRGVCLDTLKYIKKICETNKIAYSLTGGTLLGAVRHKGFIPWDDDVDVFMTRPEYRKFEHAMETQDKYLWLTNKHDPKYHLNYGRVVDKRTVIQDEGLPDIDGYGIFVDICVVDGLPDNYIKRLLHISYIRLLYRCRRSASYTNKEFIPKNPIKRLIKGVFQKYTRRVGVAAWVKRLERIISKYQFDEGIYVGNIMSQYGRKEVMHRSAFADYIDMSFENDNFKVCVGWQEYLSNIYGDYMQIPPPEERVGHHMGNAYWIISPQEEKARYETVI